MIGVAAWARPQPVTLTNPARVLQSFGQLDDAIGAAVGVVLAGPVGVVEGGTLGAVVGALGAAAGGHRCEPEAIRSADPVPADAVRLPP